MFCSHYSICKIVFSTKIWFMKTSTRTVKYDSRVVKSNTEFWYQLRQMFLMNYQYFWGYATFLVKFWHTVKQIWSMPLCCRYTTDIVWHVSVAALKLYCSEMRGSWVIGAYKSDKNMMLFGKCLYLVKLTNY